MTDEIHTPPRERKTWTTPQLIDLDADVEDVEGGGGFAPDGPAGFTDS